MALFLFIGFCVDLCFGMHYFVSFLVLQSFDKEERDGCFALIVLCLVTVNVLWLFPAGPWVGLQCVIVVFPDHVYLIFEKKL